MTTKKQEIRRLRAKAARQAEKMNELHELIGVERGRADALRQEADFWKHQVALWQQKATAAANEALRLRRKQMKILQDPSDVQDATAPPAMPEEGMEGWRKVLREAAENHRKKETEAQKTETK